MSSVPPAIADAYDAERFRREGHALVDVLADALARMHRREGRVLPWREPAEARDAWAAEGWGAEARAEGGDGPRALADDMARVVAASTALHSPRYLGHQVAPALPTAALAELVSALCNQGTGVFEMGPAAAPIELAVIQWMCARAGYAGGGGALTSGGSLGNLTALLAMRQVKAAVWERGTERQLAVITSSDAHYSVARAVRVMGWGDAGVITVPVDREHRLRAADVEKAIDERVIGIVAAGGSTATGAFDPLDEIADLAERRGLWLHVDAAHGGGALLSAQHRSKLSGIARADSIVWDAHKLMMMPALVTAVLFKDEAHAYEAFAQQASYLFAGGAPRDTWWDLGQRTLECTKRMMSIELWAALRQHGEVWFGNVVDRLFELTRVLADKIVSSGDFELALPPEANIVCYRLRGADNRALREACVRDGRFYIVGTQLDGSYWLRSTVMNPLTEPADFDALLEHLRSLCRK
ncbi:MAG: aminotransferase class V-fold PLP-dependent enzyme [Deltaproteobacteria bacterium]|nr:aminotransferase class V-fold PLP-dependent enzyme [Deltaproteobacteria bacterium]